MAEFSATSLAATPVVLIALTAGLLLTLAIGQAVQVAERRRRQRRQLETALQLRARELQDALTHLAPALLGQQLRQFIAGELVDLRQQLCQLAPGLPSRDALAQAQALQGRLGESTESDSDTPPHPGRLREARQLLRQIHSHIRERHEQGQLGHSQAQEHVRQIKQGLLQLQLDGFELAAEKALAADKLALARHYHQRALTLLHQHSHGAQYDDKIARLETLIKELDDLEKQQQAAAMPSSEAWNQLGNDESWKKKTLYD